MLFHEIYGSYFNVMAAVLKEACGGLLTGKRMHEIVREKAFGESGLNIPSALRDGDWSLLTAEFGTPVKDPPSMPLTTLQKRWMRALLSDPRIALFGVAAEGLEDVQPLYTPEAFCYFDRYSDGDAFTDEAYISRFQTILGAVRERKMLDIRFQGRHGIVHRQSCFPWHLEYSSKDDKFRLIATKGRADWTINLGRVLSVEVLGAPDDAPMPPRSVQHTLVMELVDERNALERAMLHFSHLEKETERLDDTHYRITLRYDRDDETELLIRVLSFGPKIRVLSPGSFIERLRERLIRQQGCGLK